MKTSFLSSGWEGLGRRKVNLLSTPGIWSFGRRSTFTTFCDDDEEEAVGLLEEENDGLFPCV